MPKLKEFFSDIRMFNNKYKCAPLIIFALIYVASPIDLLPELFFDPWVFYIDDMAVLIFAFVITYLEVFYNERNYKDNENVEGVYSAVRRGGGELGSRRNIGGNSSSDCDAVHNALIDQIPPAELPAAVVTSVEQEITPVESKPIAAEPKSEQSTNDSRDIGFYEQHFINSASKSDYCVQQVAELSRPESFVIEDGNAILW